MSYVCVDAWSATTKKKNIKTKQHFIVLFLKKNVSFELDPSIKGVYQRIEPICSTPMNEFIKLCNTSNAWSDVKKKNIKKEKTKCFLNDFKKKKLCDDLNADQFDPMCDIPDSNRYAVASS